MTTVIVRQTIIFVVIFYHDDQKKKYVKMEFSIHDTQRSNYIVTRFICLSIVENVSRIPSTPQNFAIF